MGFIESVFVSCFFLLLSFVSLHKGRFLIFAGDLGKKKNYRYNEVVGSISPL
ncbi:unknown protein [Microcystis aeruginosa NIES-843]|uniref:Uncharacterized protein n=1 Tax=Microcystis aeruginosa (strain NIES-843 / IAM M-2473) TaxID=449447 RepID=B0JUY3_MICAN|nr:unknown protein [Microcystis aeruginosa NIES-843]